MSFEHREEHDELRASVRRFLASHSDEAAVRRLMATDHGHDPEVWAVMAGQLGLQGLVIPEEHGGSGVGLVELQVVLEEMGGALLCAPFLSTAVLATQVLLAVDDDEIRAELLPRIADGSAVVAVAVAEGVATGEPTRAVRESDGWALTGTKAFVVDGLVASDLLVTAATEDGPGLFLVDPVDVDRVPMTTLDETRKQATVRLDAALARRVGEPGTTAPAMARAMGRARALLAAESAGVCRRMLDITVEYASVRHQFGRPIGSYQAVKHLCAGMLIDTELATSTARAAGWAYDEGAPDADVLSRVAAAVAGESLEKVAAEMVQVHGGIGFTWEHPAHLYLKRAASSARLWGSTTEHRAAIFEAVAS